MKLGIYLHGSSPFRPRGAVENYVKAAQEYENAGAGTIWSADHLIRTPDPNNSPLYETWILIAGLAMKTSTIRFGTMVSPITFRNIGLFAKMVSTVDHLSQGRITVGLGAGWFQKEHSMFGLKLGSVGYRMDFLEEYVLALKSLWIEDFVDRQGKHINLDGAYLNPKPIQSPHPPLLIGGGGEKRTLRLVAKYADMSNFGGDPATIQHKLGVLENHCQEVGRGLNEIEATTNMAIVLGKNQSEVEKGIESYRKRFVELGMQAPSKDTFSDNRLVGTVEEVASQIEQISGLGIDHINLTVNDEQTENYLPQLLSLYS